MINATLERIPPTLFEVTGLDASGPEASSRTMVGTVAPACVVWSNPSMPRRTRSVGGDTLVESALPQAGASSIIAESARENRKGGGVSDLRRSARDLSPSTSSRAAASRSNVLRSHANPENAPVVAWHRAC